MRSVIFKRIAQASCCDWGDMTSYNPGGQQYYPPPPGPPPVQVSTPWYRRLWIVALIAAVVGIGIGAASSGSAKKSAAKPGPTVTAVQTVVSTAPAPAAGTRTLRPTIVKTIATRTRTRTVTYTPAPKPAFNDGTYKVGRDIKSGEYRTSGGGDCYYQRMSNLNGGLDSIIVNDNFTGSALVDVNNGEYLQVSGGCDWRHT